MRDNYIYIHKKIHTPDLEHLSHDDLEELIPKIGPRNKLKDYILQLENDAHHRGDHHHLEHDPLEHDPEYMSHQTENVNKNNNSAPMGYSKA